MDVDLDAYNEAPGAPRRAPRPSRGPRLWRCEPMSLVQLFIQYDAARDTVDELGNLGIVQFKDLNANVSAFARVFVADVKRAEEMERRLRYLKQQLDTRDISVDDPFTLAAAPTDEDLTFDALETRLEEEETAVRDAVQSLKQLEGNREELEELRAVLEATERLFVGGARPVVPVERAAAARPSKAPSTAASALLSDDHNAEDDAVESGALEDVEAALPVGGQQRLQVVAGTVEAGPKSRAFERVLWRATRGNVYLRLGEGPSATRATFIVVYSSNNIHAKITKICDAFGARVYPCPEESAQRLLLLDELRTRMAELALVEARSALRLDQMLRRVAERYGAWRERVRRDKAVRHVLNLFNYDVGRRCLIAEAWVVSARLDEVGAALKRGCDRSGSQVPSIMQVLDTSDVDPSTVPTYFKTNKFTKPFNNIVEAYGVAAHGEVNPATWAIATFPFLFGVMYGDIGHGMMLFALPLVLILFERRIRKYALGEVLGMMFAARYLLLLMAMCAVYVGFLYNEFYALPHSLDRSSWTFAPNGSQYMVPIPGRAVFPFGVDPAWKVASNELTFYNSLKMKIAIILAYLHMMLGIAMHAFNAVHFRRPYDLWFEFIPRAIFLTCIIGYMVLIIFWKWITPWASVQPVAPDQIGNGASAAPYIISIMISMFLTPGASDPKLCRFMLGCPTQGNVQLALLLIAVLMVPVMLLVKPLLILRDSKQGTLHPDYTHGHTFEFGELMVHQIIETIEFVLGAISNTASYLRLWALSLAHSELSIVFWEKAIGTTIGLSVSNPGIGFIAMFVGWGLWAGFTVGVLLGMETLSTFLHTLRLHWVEFQNKFYKGTGVKFAPFSYSKLLKQEMAVASEGGDKDA